MKIYLAAPFSASHQVEYGYARDLMNWGHIVVSQWHHDVSLLEDLGQAARRDLEDILCADILILLAELQTASNTGGRHVEFGFALARNKRVMVVGSRQNLFHYLPNVETFPTWKQCLDFLCNPWR